MKYRIIELEDGTYQAQWRFFWVLWFDSAYGANDLQSAKQFVGVAEPKRAKMVRVVTQ